MAPMVRQEWDVNRGFSQKKKKKIENFAPKFFNFFSFSPQISFFQFDPPNPKS